MEELPPSHQWTLPKEISSRSRVIESYHFSIIDGLDFLHWCRVSVDKSEFDGNISFGRAEDGKNFAIVISKVEPGSASDKVHHRIVKLSHALLAPR